MHKTNPISKEQTPMTDVYKRLAKHLDNLPAGFPETESGVELRILERLFTKEEAETALLLSMIPETSEQVAARTGQDKDKLEKILYDMSKKGLVYRAGKGSINQYSAAQFVIGIWEYNVNNLTPELIKDVNEYLPHLMTKSWVKQKTKQLRIVPVSKSISAEIKVMPYEIAEEIVNSQSKIVVAPCICRREHEMVGKGCGKMAEACLIFGGGAFFYEQNGLGRTIDKKEALEILEKGLEDGLVLQPGNSKKPTNICMCCGCCCQVLKNLGALDEPAKVVLSNYYAEIDAEACIGCGVCEDRCQMKAITVDGTAVVDLNRCIGCGICVPKCEVDAISMRQKQEEPLYEPPNTVVDTYMNIAIERGLL